MIYLTSDAHENKLVSIEDIVNNIRERSKQQPAPSFDVNIIAEKR